MTNTSSNEKVFTVAEFLKYVNSIFKQNPILQHVKIKGEISSFKTYPSGHSYFTIKDENSAVDCVLFRRYAHNVKFRPEVGMEIVVNAETNIYDKTGRFQLIVKEMQKAGIGDLYIAFQRLKEKLSKEGLFDSKRKQKIPTMPKQIVAITSEAGAVIRDIIHVLSRRYPGFSLLLIPVPVQGKGAEIEIAAAIERANREELGDVIIVGRGGGSIEDLQPFNEEIVARAIAASKIPVISAVGHETDFTIADFVADQRVPTPSAAAECAVPVKRELFQRLEQLSSSLEVFLYNKIRHEKKHLEQLRQRPVLSQAHEFVAPQKNNLIILQQKLNYAINQKLQAEAKLLLPIKNNLWRPQEKRLSVAEEITQKLLNKMQKLYLSDINKEKLRFERLSASLDALSPLAILARGYSISYAENGKLIRSAQQVKTGDALTLELMDGKLLCKVRDIVLKKKKELL